MKTRRFGGRRIVVTGAASGLGNATPQQLALEGAEVIGLDLDIPMERPAGIDFHSVDITNKSQIDMCLNVVRRDGRPIDGVAAFAGIECPGTIEVIEEADWLRCLQVNLMGSVNIVRATLGDMKSSGRASIVLCSTQLSISGGRDCVAYAASKGAINSLCKSLALDCAPWRVRVNAIAPGAIETPMMDRVFSNLGQQAIDASRLRHPLGRFGTAVEVASMACYLLSDEASFVTGTIIPVDGGWTSA